MWTNPELVCQLKKLKGEKMSITSELLSCVDAPVLRGENVKVAFTPVEIRRKLLVCLTGRRANRSEMTRVIPFTAEGLSMQPLPSLETSQKTATLIDLQSQARFL